MCIEVGIRLCGSSGDLMVDDIMGVSANLVQSLKDDEQQKFSDYFNQLRDSSYKNFLKDLEIELLKRKSFKHIVSESKPYSGKRHTELYTTIDRNGYRIELPYHQFTEYQLRAIELYAHKFGDVKIEIFDLITAQLLYSKDFTLNRGKNTLKIDETFSSQLTTEIFVALTNIDSVLMEVTCGEMCGSCWMVSDCEVNYGRLDFTEVDQIDYINTGTTDTVYEKLFCINGAIRCNLEAILCEYKEFFGEAVKYKLGIEILNSKLNSDKRNWYTSANFQEIREFTLPELKEEYYKRLNLAITNISDLLNDSICWSCDGVNSLIPQSSSYV